jgi:ribosomal protein S18 acetylase RimI-like enzyme
VDNIVIRPGRLEDEPYIQEFTRHTFDWGDYVADSFGDWVREMAQGKGEVYVAVSMPSGTPVGVNHARYISPVTAWFEGIRVHPDFRRAGIGRLLTVAAIEGARRRGKRVCRAAIDGDNEKSQGLARGFGFEPVVPIVEFDIDLARLEACVAPRVAGRPSPLILRDATEADAPAMFHIVSKEMSYIGCDYTWWRATLESILIIIAERKCLVAVEGDKVVAGAVLSDTFVDEHSEQPVLYGEISSVFGDIEGVLAIAGEYGGDAARKAAEKGLPGKLSVTCEARSKIASVLPSHGFTERYLEGRRDEIWLWELLLNN